MHCVFTTPLILQAEKLRQYMVTKFVDGAREDDWEEKEPPERFARIAVRILKKLSSNSNLTMETLIGQSKLDVLV